MADDVAVKVLNGRRISAALRKAGHDLAEVKEAKAKVGTFVATLSAAAAPRLSGLLAFTVRGSRAASRVTISAGGAAAPYAGPVHWGWPARNIEGQPFIADTAQASEPTWLGFYEADMQSIAARFNATT